MIVKGSTAKVEYMSDEPDEVDPADVEHSDSEEESTEAQASVEDEPDIDAEDTDTSAGDVNGEESDEEEIDGLQDGDFILIAYTARTVEDDQLVDTTEESVAEEEGVEDQGTFEPRTIVLGEGHLFAAIEDDIRGKDVGESGTVAVPAEEAFGEYDEENVRTVSADKIDEDDRYPGAQVQIDGEQGYLETIIGGRARVDFNHPLAGEDIEYTYEIIDTVDDEIERAQGLLSMFLNLDLEMWIETDEVEETSIEEPDEEDEDAEPETVTETVEKRTLYIESTPQLALNQQWMFQKQQIAQQLIEALEIDRILIQEVLEGTGGFGLPGMGGDLDAMLDEEDISLDADDIDADDIVDELEEEIEE